MNQFRSFVEPRGHKTFVAKVVSRANNATWLSRALLGLLFVLLGLPAQTIAKSKPNILILFADDLGWVDLSSPDTSLGHASRFFQTPNIDRLAKDGLSFTAAYTQQNCAPTRASLLSGQYAPNNLVYNVWALDRELKKLKGKTAIVPTTQREKLDPDKPSLFKAMQQAGYLVAHFGKTHGWGNAKDNKLMQEKFGIDLNYGAEKKQKILNKKKKKQSVNYWAVKTDKGWQFPNPKKMNKYAQPYSKTYIEKNLLPFANGNDPSTLLNHKKHFTDALTDAVIDVIAGHHHKGNKPLLLNVSYHTVHSPMVPRPDLHTKYKALKSSDQRHNTRAKYAAMVEQLDQSVGRILHALNDPNGDGNTNDSIRDDTLVFFLSDNGGAHFTDNTPLRNIKGSFFEGGIRVPFIASWPGVTSPGTQQHEPVHVVDFFPTLLELAQAKAPKKHRLDGESFVSLMKNHKATMRRDAIYWHFPGYMDTRMSQPNSAINKRFNGKRYKLKYYYESMRYELYNISDDLAEQHDLLVDPAGNESKVIANYFSADLVAWLKENKAAIGTYRDSGDAVKLPRPTRFSIE